MLAKNASTVVHDEGFRILYQSFWFSSCSTIAWKGEILLVGQERLSRILEVADKLNDFI